jgi:hypothetical protein
MRFIQWVASRRAYSARSHSSRQSPGSLHLGVREQSRIADTHRFRARSLTSCQTHEDVCYALLCWHLMWWLPGNCPGCRRPGASLGCNAQSSSQASGTQGLKCDLGFLASAPPVASQKSRRASAQKGRRRGWAFRVSFQSKLSSFSPIHVDLSLELRQIRFEDKRACT